MLRITVNRHSGNEHEDAACLRLEGQLRDEWCDMLEQMCHSLSADGIELTLDMAGVTYVDNRGITLIKGNTRKPHQAEGVQYFLQALFDNKKLLPTTQFRA